MRLETERTSWPSTTPELNVTKKKRQKKNWDVEKLLKNSLFFLFNKNY